eukprot:3322426-Amphidinium_carterae.1
MSNLPSCSRVSRVVSHTLLGVQLAASDVCTQGAHNLNNHHNPENFLMGGGTLMAAKFTSVCSKRLSSENWQHNRANA